MIGYGQFCPVAQALEIVGERWTLLVVRELLHGNYRFGELLNGVPLMSRSLLAQRLKSLEDAGLLERRARDAGGGHEYRLTEAGRDLAHVVVELGAWGQRWLGRQTKAGGKLDPVVLMWDVRRNLDTSSLPAEETVVMFWFRDLAGKGSRFWFKVNRPEVDLCFTNPGLDVALSVETTLQTMVDVWMGDRDVREAIRAGAISLDGAPALARTFPRWLLLSKFAKIERAESALPAARAS
jgi:DNA-binding HxlR family transcriptional regulator